MHPIDRLGVVGIFCAYAGNGNTVFPKRDKIVRDLSMNKDTYTKYLSQLTDAGYIDKQRTPIGNRYTINLQVPDVGEPESGIPGDSSILTSRTIKAHGFGTVPKLVMLDRRLSAQAKAIYAYFCSFTGAGTVAFPHKATIHRELAISPRTYYLHFASLTGFGYITTRQRKNRVATMYPNTYSTRPWSRVKQRNLDKEKVRPTPCPKSRSPVNRSPVK